MKLVKRGRNYFADFTVDGKRVRKSTHTANRAEAEAWLSVIQTSRKMPTFEEAIEVLKMLYKRPVEGVLPLSSIWESYTRLAKSLGKDAIEQRSQDRRKQIVARFIKWICDERPTIKTIEAVTAPIAAGFAEHLAGQIGRDGKPLKSKTRANIIGELGTVWRILEKASDKIRNPWAALSPTDTDSTVGKAFTQDQEDAVMVAAKKAGHDWFAICMIMRWTGLRYSDVARLTWGEVDFDRGVIRRTPNKTKRHGIVVVVPMVAEVRGVIVALKKDGEYLFPLHAELYGNRGRAAREVLNFPRDVLKVAGITEPGYTIHSFRHTAATRLAENGASIETRKRILGHTEDATAERYDHFEHIEELREALELTRRP